MGLSGSCWAISGKARNGIWWEGDTAELVQARLGMLWLKKEPEVPCLLSSLLSMRSWVWLAEVRAEKVRKWLMYSRGRFLRSLLETVRVFPVPVGPIHSTWEGGEQEWGTRRADAEGATNLLVCKTSHVLT